MKRIMLGLVLVLLLSSVSYADSIKFQWDRNLESDMGHYTLYQCNTGVCTTKTAVGLDIPHPSVGQYVTYTYAFTPPPGTEEVRYYTVSATDQIGNESGISNVVNTRVDNKPPAIPGSLIIVLIN